ncbi:MAG: cadherin repeat domain-containing protein [Candidatus Aminicenantes bacterium]|nr:cadherin repeat domain-containing protein [Candidatus Aminicenantes bacterium]
MKKASGIVLMLVWLVMSACGGSGAADNARPGDDAGSGQVTGKPPVRGASGKADQSAAAGVQSEILRLSAVRLSTDNFYAHVDLSAEVEVAPPVPEGIAFEYRWYVNNKEVADATGPILSSDNFRKHEWIICQARATDGDLVSPWLKSNWVRAADSPPQIEPIPIRSFTVPGRFSYQITASDADNDELTYELLSPLDMGIELDKKTGLLTWNLDEATVDKLGETIDISLSISDNDAPPTTGSLTLRFQKRTEKRNP